MSRKPMGSSSAQAFVQAMSRSRLTAAGHRLMHKNVVYVMQLISQVGDFRKGDGMVLKKIVDKCNYDKEGPGATEHFLPIPPLPEEEAKVVADIINRAAGPNSSRYWKVVDLDYKLWKFEV